MTSMAHFRYTLVAALTTLLHEIFATRLFRDFEVRKFRDT